MNFLSSNMQPTETSWILDFLRVAFMWIVRILGYLADILLDVIRYIISLDFLNSSVVTEFLDKYRYWFYILLAFSILAVGFVIVTGTLDMKKTKIRNAIFSIMLIVCFPIFYPKLVDISKNASQEFAFSGQSVAETMIKDSVQVVAKDNNGNWIYRGLTEQEAKDLLYNPNEVSVKGDRMSGALFWGEHAYKYDLPWLQLVAVFIVLIGGMYMIGFKAFNNTIDMGVTKILSIFAFPLAIYSEQARKKWIISVSKTLALMPMTMISLVIFVGASSWLMKLQIFNNSVLSVYADDLLKKSLASMLFYIITIPALANVLINGSNVFVEFFGIDTGINSAVETFMTMQAMSEGTKAVGRGFVGGAKALGSGLKTATQTGLKGGGFVAGMTEELAKSFNEAKDNVSDGLSNDSLNEEMKGNDNMGTTLDDINNIPDVKFAESSTEDLDNENGIPDLKFNENPVENISADDLDLGSEFNDSIPNLNTKDKIEPITATDLDLEEPKKNIEPITADSLEEPFQSKSNSDDVNENLNNQSKVSTSDKMKNVGNIIKETATNYYENKKTNINENDKGITGFVNKNVSSGVQQGASAVDNLRNKKRRAKNLLNRVNQVNDDEE